jgi:hypothetical protein
VSVTDSPPFDPDTAGGGLWLLRDAHDHWLADVAEVSGQRAGPEHRHLALRMHQHAASVLLWARGLDDLCDGDPDPLPSYRAARPSMAPVLAAARYAANRAVHQLLTLTRSVPGFTFPITFPLAIDKLGRFDWAPEAVLPSVSSERPGQQRLRAEYVSRMAGQPVGVTLQLLRDWFEQQLT